MPEDTPAKSLLVTIDAEAPLPGRYRVGGRPAAASLEDFAELCAKQGAQELGSRPYARAILVGDGERLEREGFEFAGLAKRGGFSHIRLDTSPRRLTEAPQVRAVVGVGVTEFSIGLHAPEAALHDRLCGRAGEFEQIERAFTRLSHFPIRVLVDVVVSAANLAHLPATIERAIAGGAKRVALHSYCPTFAPGAKPGPDDPGIVSFAELVPALGAGVAQCEAAGVETTLHRVPACMLGVHAKLLDNSVPDALGGVRPGRPLPEFNCLLEAQCELSEVCGGLHHAYVNAHGWELERLDPVPRERPFVPRDRSVETQTGGMTGPRGHAHWLSLLGSFADRVEGVGLTRKEARYPMQMRDGTRFILILTPRDSTVRYFKQSRSFNLSYTDVEGPAKERAIANYIEPVLAEIVSNDRGELSF